MSPRDPSMDELPEPVMFHILSRLLVKTIIHCKCVCKKRLDLILDSYFVNHHMSGFLICHKPRIFKWIEVEDEPDHHNLHHGPVMSLDLNLAPILKESLIIPVGSVNGSVCLRQVGRSIDNFYICNPITREYMILLRPQYHFQQGPTTIKYCFGVGSLTRKYKVIRIFQKPLIFPDSTPKFRPGLSEAEVYTLGTSQWRSLGHVPYRFKERYEKFLNGHAHWTIHDQDTGENICAFNFHNETFEFPSPPSEAIEEGYIHLQRLGVLKSCLCQCDTYNSKLTVWVMREYGIRKSWHKELVIQQSIFPTYDMRPAFPVEGFKDGTILMACYRNNLIVYFPRRKAVIETQTFGSSSGEGLAYRPSFHRLQNFENESVHVISR